MPLSDDFMAEPAHHTGNHRAFFSDEDWFMLQVSVILVCRPGDLADEDRWRAVGCALRALAAEANRAEHKGDVALAVLASLTDVVTCSHIMAEARQLAEALSEKDLQVMTARAGYLVERACPDQGFNFRALLSLVSMEIH